MQEAQVDALLSAAEDGVDCDGLRVTVSEDGYDVALGSERYDDVDADTLRSIVAERPAYVENWHFWSRAVPPGEDRRAFLRWLEHPHGQDRAELEAPALLERVDAGLDASWGQLHVSIEHAGHGHRRYELRHEADVEAGEGAEDPSDQSRALTEYDDPLDARELAKHDERDRYRPLSTAPTLQRGWQFPSLDADELVRAIECFYPATIPNWYRERTGDLDVTHWRETAERQTGIYDVIEDLPREAVDWLAEACCVDSQCLKRREWEYEEGDDLAPEGGEGLFPCREPCSLVVAAARKFAILESETERTYEFELTPSEKHQLEELIDAVADGRVEEIREADVGDGANRYRARYLKAKRLDEDGELPDVSEQDS